MTDRSPTPGRRIGSRRPGKCVRGRFALVLAVAAASVGCATDEPVVAYRLAEYLEIAPATSSAVRLIPGPDGSGRLTEGWSPTGDGTDRWAEGRAVHAEFDLPVARATELVIEARPYAPEGAPAQWIEARVNETLLGRQDMETRRAEYVFAIPEEILRAGRNELQLQFDHALVPAREEGSDDFRQLAARVSGLWIGRQRSAPPGEQSEPDLRVESSAGEGIEGVRVSVREGLWHEVWLDVPAGALLKGAVSGGAAVFLEDPAGETTLLVELQPASAPSDFEIDLSSWEGSIVRLWLGGESGPEGRIVWHDPRILAPVSAVPVAALVTPEPAATVEAEMERPDIFVIVLDAARADAFQPYGAERPTPAIQALADDGTVFLTAYSSAPWTGQAIPGLFSGRYPEAHGVDTWGYPLAPSIPTLAEAVGGLGYHTVLWTQHAIYGGNRTLRRGFDEFLEGPTEEPGVVPGLEDLLLEGSPTFALLHWLPPHGPYDPPAPFRDRYSGWQSERLNANAQFLNRFPRQQDPATLPEEHVRYVRDRYDEHVAYADDIVGRFLDQLRAAGRYDDALIVLVSDHGEAFLEHGWFLHTRFLYEEVMRVPFVIKWPRSVRVREPRVTAPVSTAQLLPTVIDALGIDRPDLRPQTGSLLPLTLGSEERPPWIYFSSRGVAPPDRDPRPLWGIRIGDLKLIYSLPDDRYELYDLAADPSERQDLAPAQPRLARFLYQQASLQRRRNEMLLLAEEAGGQIEELSQETIDRLRALGYIQ